MQTDSVQITIQDGEDAGQTVEHCHFHIIPITKKHNFNESLDSSQRIERTQEDMEKETEIYREAFVLN